MVIRYHPTRAHNQPKHAQDGLAFAAKTILKAAPAQTPSYRRRSHPARRSRVLNKVTAQGVYKLVGANPPDPLVLSFQTWSRRKAYRNWCRRITTRLGLRRPGVSSICRRIHVEGPEHEPRADALAGKLVPPGHPICVSVAFLNLATGKPDAVLVASPLNRAAVDLEPQVVPP